MEHVLFGTPVERAAGVSHLSCCKSLPFQCIGTDTSPFPRHGLNFILRSTSIPPAPAQPLPSTVMDPATSRILQLQLETTLRLLVSLSPLMSPNDIMTVRIRLAESDIILGRLLAERDAASINSKLNRPQSSPFI